jgi:hypothetical protein
MIIPTLQKNTITEINLSHTLGAKYSHTDLGFYKKYDHTSYTSIYILILT